MVSVSLLGLSTAKIPLPHVALPEFGMEVSLKGFQVNKFFLSKCFLGIVSPEEDCAENFPCGGCNSHLGKGFKAFPHS